MSLPWPDFIDALKTPPDNLSIIPNPLFEQQDEFEEALLQLELYPSLYGATFLRPTKAWDTRALTWTRNGPIDAAVSAWISRALAEAVFDAARWFEELASDRNPRLREIFAEWGRSDLQSFLSACDRHFQPELRIQILTTILGILLSIPYVPGTPSNATAMYALANHPFLDTVITSLLLDTGNKLFPLGLRTILTVIPYAPQIITLKVPLVMVILGRAVCWRDRPFVDAGQTSDSLATVTPLPRHEWSVATSAQEKAIDLPISLQPVNIVRLWLVAIYGAWPSNLLAFVRDPVMYLRGKQVESPYQVEWEDVWATGLLAARTGPLLREFSLHPSIMYFNSDGELQDAKRWEKIDPPEHVSRAHIIAHSERLSHGKTDFFDEDPASTFHSVQVSEAPTPTESGGPTISDDVGRLQRENVLLRIEAGYADRLRKQYLFHIGRLHKHSMRFSIDEAEVHKFANLQKDQKSQIEALTNELSQHRRDSSQAQQKHSKWQEQLRDKLGGFRDDKINWQNEAVSIRTHRSDLETTVLRQKAELAQVKNERFKLQNQLTEVLPKVRRIEDYEIRMKQLTDTQRLWDRDVDTAKAAVAEAEKWKARAWQLEQLLRSVQRPVERSTPTEQPQHLAVPVSEAFKTAPVQPDMDHYVAIADRAQRRVEELERANLELQVEMTRLKTREPPQASDGGDREFLWAG